MKKNLKNYTAEAPVERSIAKIEEILVRHGTTRFYKEYKDSELVGVVFVVPLLNGELPVKLPARIEQVRQRLYGKRSAYTPAMSSQAQRTAWANIRDWIDAQIALIETGQVKLEEIFLPYTVDTSGTTLYERMQENNFKLPNSNKDERGTLTGTIEV
jgi:hypothetical protein